MIEKINLDIFEKQFPSLKGKSYIKVDGETEEISIGFDEVMKYCVDKQKVREFIDKLLGNPLILLSLDFEIRESLKSLMKEKIEKDLGL